MFYFKEHSEMKVEDFEEFVMLAFYALLMLDCILIYLLSRADTGA